MKTPRLFVHCIATALAMVATTATPFVLGANIASAHSVQHTSKHATHWLLPYHFRLIENYTDTTTTADGDLQKYDNDLYASDGSTLVGKDDGICTQAGTSTDRSTCTYTFTTTDGSRSISASGLDLKSASSNTYAIIGGTGLYAGAEGYIVYSSKDSTDDYVDVYITSF